MRAIDFPVNYFSSDKLAIPQFRNELEQNSTPLMAPSDNQLIHRMAENPGDEALWQEFLIRFEKLIAAIIIRQCNRLGYEEGRKKVNDLMQEVFIKLLKNDGKALKNFRGRHEKSIVKYLTIAAVNVVYNDFAMHCRRAGAVIASLDEERQISEECAADLHDITGDSHWDAEIRQDELIEEIEDCLEKIFRKRRHAERDMLIFYYYLYGGFKAKEIASSGQFDLSEKRIANLISRVKNELRTRLGKRKI